MPPPRAHPQGAVKGRAMYTIPLGVLCRARGPGRSECDRTCASEQKFHSLPMMSPLLLEVERMERSQSGMRRLSPAARAHQAKRGSIMYR